MNVSKLKKLGLTRSNAGTSTGLKSWKGRSPMIASHSPVDGKLIGNVSTTSKADYNKVVKTAQKPLKNGVSGQHLSEEKSSDNMAMP